MVERRHEGRSDKVLGKGRYCDKRAFSFERARV